MFQGYSDISHSTVVPANNDGEEGGCTSSDCQSNQSESSTDSKGRLSFLETELQARTRDLDRLKFKIDKMKTHQISSPVTSRRETKPINVKIEVERLRKDKKVMAELLKQSQQELTRKDSINRKLKMENDKISRNMIALQGKIAENGRTQNLLEELNRVRSELSVLTNKTDRLTPAYQGQSTDKGDKGRYIEELVIEKEQLKQCLSAIYFKITPYAVSLPSRSATPPVWTEDVKNSFDQFWEEKIKLQRELEELREQIKPRESLAEQNRTYPECYETSVSECSTTDSKSDYLSDATIIKVPRPTVDPACFKWVPPWWKGTDPLTPTKPWAQDERGPTPLAPMIIGHHDLESEVCRWKEMYQNVYDKYRSSQHTIGYHEKKFKKIYSIMDDLAKRVYGEESFSENVSGYNITKIVQKLTEEYDHLQESVKKVKHEEQFQTDLQKSIIEAEKTLEEKGRNARTLRNAIGTLQLTSNMETKVASLAETMLLIYNNQLNWLKQLEHNNTLPNSEGEETHSNSPNQCELDLPIQDDEKVENRLSGGDAMSCSSESNESSTCDANEDIQKNRISDLNLECTSDNLVQNDNKVELNEGNIVGEKDAEDVGVHESGKTDESQEEVKIENAEAVLEEKKDANDAVEDEGGEEKEENTEKEAGDSNEKENLDNSESVEQATGTDVQTEETEANVSEKIQNDAGNENDQEEKKSESNAEEAKEEVNETKSDEVSEENKGDQEQETEEDNADENKGEEDKEEEKDSEETKKDEEDGKDEDDNDDDSKEPQNNSNADGEENTENEKDNTENSSKENKEEEPKKNKDTDGSDGTKEGEEVENENEDTTEIDESCEIDENSEITDKTEDKENVENNTEKQTEDIEENENKSVSEQSVEKSKDSAIEETVIKPKSSEDIQSEPEGHSGDGKGVSSVETSEEANETCVCPEEKTNVEDPENQNSENADVNDEEKIKNQSDESQSKSNDGKEECNENHLVQTVDDEIHNSAETENCATEKSESEIESQHESDRISTIPEAEEENQEASGTEEENKEDITEAEEEKKEASEVEEENKEDITEAEKENKVASEVEEENKEASEVEEENKEASEAEEKNEDITQAEENKEPSDTNDLTKDNEEANKGNNQSENVTATEEHSELNLASNSSCTDGTTNGLEENSCVSVKSSQADDGKQESIQHESTEASDKQIIINETEQTNTEESPCSSVSQSVNDNKDKVKIIINPASSEEHESANEETSQVCTNNDQENVDETENSLNESKSESLVNDESTIKDEPELAPVIEPEITKVVIEPRKSVFFSNINVLEKDATSEHKIHKEASRQSEEESLSKRIEELETEMSEMLEVKRHHMKVACDLAEKLEAMKKRESDLQDQLSNAETKTSQEVEVLCKEWSGKEQSYQDEIAAWKENVEQQNSVLQRLKSDLDHAQQMAQFKENETAQLRGIDKEKQPESLLERETQTSDQEEDPNSKELQETVDRLRLTSEHYQQQLMENRTVVREVKSIIEGSVAQLVTLKAMGTKHMKREYVYRSNLAQKEIDLKHLQSELDKQSIDARAKVNIIEKQRNEIRSLREEVRKCQKDISAKVEFIDELQSRMQVLISCESRPNSSNPEDLEIYTIGRLCIDEQHPIKLEKQREELERMRQELHHLELKFSDIDSAAESSDHQNLSHPGSAGSVGSVSEELPIDGNLCLCKRKDVSKILKLSEESYLNLLASLVVCLGIHDIKYNKSLQRLSWSQCKEISAERKANQKKIMKVIQGLKKEERTVSPRIHQPERSKSTGETEKRRGLVKCISPQNGRSMYISDMIKQAEESLDKDKGTKTDGRKPTSWRPHTSLNDRRIPLELKNGEILALLGNADPKSVPKPTLSSK